MEKIKEDYFNCSSRAWDLYRAENQIPRDEKYAGIQHCKDVYNKAVEAFNKLSETEKAKNEISELRKEAIQTHNSTRNVTKDGSQMLRMSNSS